MLGLCREFEKVLEAPLVNAVKLVADGHQVVVGARPPFLSGPKFLVLVKEDKFSLITLPFRKRAYFRWLLQGSCFLFCFLSIKMIHFSQWKKASFSAVSFRGGKVGSACCRCCAVVQPHTVKFLMCRLGRNVSFSSLPPRKEKQAHLFAIWN